MTRLVLPHPDGPMMAARDPALAQLVTRDPRVLFQDADFDAGHYRGGTGSGSPGRTRWSWPRELMPSLAKTLARWYWTVRALMNSRAPISGLDRPSRASRATWASWAVSGSLSCPGGVRAVRLRAVRLRAV